MAAEIRPGVKFATNRKPILIGKVEGFTEDLNDARIIPGEDGVITAGDDKTVQIWLKRDSGQYWPSVCQYVPSQASCLHLNGRDVWVGCDNGTLIQYELSSDCNKLEHKIDVLSHVGRVCAIQYVPNHPSVLSVSRDKTFVWAHANTGNIIAQHTFTAWCTALQYDIRSGHAFVGDFGGQITMLKLDNNSLNVVTTFKGHTGSIRSLFWEPQSSLLFSGAFDQQICVWNIGGGRGQVLELQGHKSKVTGLAYIESSSQLISGGEDSVLVAWNMKTSRIETPSWTESDSCEICRVPYFWNLKSMFDNKKLGQRQHHCRSCGKAICDKCSSKRMSLPKLGFEFQVRVCDVCASSLKDSDRVSLASFHEAKHSIVTLSMDIPRNFLLTVGTDRVIKIWDLSPLSNVTE